MDSIQEAIQKRDDWDNDEVYSSDTPYTDPEKFGLKILEVTSPTKGEAYRFHYCVLWEHLTTGEKYWAVDSGCSCPRPFERVKSLGDLSDLKFTQAEYERTKKQVRDYNLNAWQDTYLD